MKLKVSNICTNNTVFDFVSLILGSDSHVINKKIKKEELTIFLNDFLK